MVERKSKYRLFRLEFPYGVHFGKRALEDTDITFYADTLFSAFCQEAVRQGTLNRWLELFEKKSFMDFGRISLCKTGILFAETYYVDKNRKAGRRFC